jgi:hypothetical protein
VKEEATVREHFGNMFKGQKDSLGEKFIIKLNYSKSTASTWIKFQTNK